MRHLKTGGEGHLYRAVDTQGEFGEVVLKIPRDTTPQGLSRFESATETLRSMNHPHVARALDTGRLSDGTPFHVIAYQKNGTLSDLLRDRRTIPWEQVVELGIQLSRATQYVCEHRRRIHCDIKPDNILLNVRLEPILTDFGVSSPAVVDSHQSDRGGTSAYFAPERLRHGSPDPRWDVWSIGVVLYELLAGHHPFAGPEPAARILMDEPIAIRSLNSNVPADVEQVVLRALKKSPGERFGSCIALADALEQTRRSRVSVTDPATAKKSTHSSSRRAMVTSLVCAVALFALAAGVLRWTPASESTVGSKGPGREFTIDYLSIEGNQEIPRGQIGSEVFTGRLGDAVRIRAQFPTPMYAYLLVIQTDGQLVVVWPSEPAEIPRRGEVANYPDESHLDEAFVFEEGYGMTAIVVVTSPEPLPSASDWLKERGEVPWPTLDTFPAGVAWHFQNDEILGFTAKSRHQTRGPGKKLAVPGRLKSLIEWLRADSNVLSVEGWAFLVTER
ncbi:MAG: protein kinase [Planctomycetota bacterium]|nr:protein kinase [Planctomycetota bacterium]